MLPTSGRQVPAVSQDVLTTQPLSHKLLSSTVFGRGCPTWPHHLPSAAASPLLLSRYWCQRDTDASPFWFSTSLAQPWQLLNHFLLPAVNALHSRTVPPPKEALNLESFSTFHSRTCPPQDLLSEQDGNGNPGPTADTAEFLRPPLQAWRWRPPPSAASIMSQCRALPGHSCRSGSGRGAHATKPMNSCACSLGGGGRPH